MILCLTSLYALISLYALFSLYDVSKPIYYVKCLCMRQHLYKRGFSLYVIIIMIIIISLFQEDNIFGTNASLKYGPRLQR